MVKRKILLLGGTGAMGIYLTPELLGRDFLIDITTRELRESNDERLRYIQGDAKDLGFLENVISGEKYDVIIDFMVYTTEEFDERCMLLLNSCQQYILLSSYRIFADSEVIDENSPRLLDTSADREYLATDDYALTKARQEDILRSTTGGNWTIVRPAITYSRDRFQLGTLEADVVIWRSEHDLPVILPKEMLSKITTMTWAGDVARIIAKLVLNKNAFGEDFNIATSEFHTWAEVADIYHDLIGLRMQVVDMNDYIDALGGGHVRYQVGYDRMFNRKLNNDKILKVVGEKREDFMSLYDGLRFELERSRGFKSYSRVDYTRQAKIDRLTRSKTSLLYADENEKKSYMRIRYPKLTKNRSELESAMKSIRSKMRLRTRIKSIRQKVRVRTRIRGVKLNMRNWHVSRMLRNPDGAIITLNGYFNYGNIIQRFALQEFLRQKGYNFISYATESLELEGEELRRFQYTSEFMRTHIVRKRFDPSERLSTYIVGSDQVWRNWGYADVTSQLGYFFLDFLEDSNAKRIAYAASFGQDNLKDAWIDRNFVNYAQPLVNKFDSISVREDSGADVLHEAWGVKAKKVLDPTMLLTSKDYSRLIRKAPYILDDVGGIFTYILTSSKNKSNIIDTFAEQSSLSVSGISFENDEVQPSVEQWLKGFRDAELVLTDSFHGAVFSIINNTPFVVIENANGGVARITSLMKVFGIEGRLLAEDGTSVVDFENLEPIDWIKVNTRLNEMRAESSDWLVNAIRH